MKSVRCALGGEVGVVGVQQTKVFLGLVFSYRLVGS